MAAVDIPYPLEAPPLIAQMLEDIPEDIGQFVLKRFDAGIFAQELVKENIAPVAPSPDNPDPPVEENVGQLEEGTYGGTQLALTEIYDRIEHAYEQISLSSCSISTVLISL